jgi:uncharacterized membrane protein YfcA
MGLAALAAFAGASVQSATGFGFALVLMPALFAVLEPAEAVAVALVLAAALSAFVLVESRRIPTHGLARLLVPALPGLAVGAVVITVVAKEPLQVSVGLAVIAAALWQLRLRELGSDFSLTPASPHLPAPLAGFLSGALTTSISINGPPLVLWLESQGVAPAVFRTTLAAAFLILDLIGVALVVAAEGSDTIDLGVLGPLLGCVAAGYAVGALAFRRLDAERFFKIVLVVVVCTGVASVVGGLISS